MSIARYRLLWLALAGVLAALFVLLVRRGEGATLPLSISDFSISDFSSPAYKIALLAFLGGAALMLFRGRFVQAVTAVLVWVLLAFALVAGYSYRFELNEVAARIMAELMPGRAIARGRTVEIIRAGTGDFDVMAQINGAPMAMVLDTGASSVVLTREDARIAGLPLEVLTYSVSVETANGRARAAPVRLDRLAVGSLAERSIEALVVQPGHLKTSLLGMSFLNRLRSWEVRGNRLVLRGYP